MSSQKQVVLPGFRELFPEYVVQTSTVQPPATAPKNATGPRPGRLHTHDNKPYECDICFKRFSRPSALVTHLNVHTGDKPFQCDWPGCDKLFSTKSNMRRHSHTHETSAGNSRQD